MKNFLLIYWLSIVVVFAIFYWEASPFSAIINNNQTNFTSYLTSLTLPDILMHENHIKISTYYGLVIEKACNGMIPYLFFVASVIAFPSTLIHKVKWMLMGYVIIMVMNTFRIWLVTQFVLQGREHFSLAHDFLGNTLLITTGLFLFIAFVKSRRKSIKEH
jgi:exosortase/archaeosortase family protein